MIALFTLAYCVSIWIFYSKMKIKPNPVNIAIASVIGLVVIGAIVIFWKFSAPSSNDVVVSRYTIQIVPQVKGPVTQIYAEPNVPLQKGVDKLFEIQKDTYQFTYNQAAATLQAATKNVEQAVAGLAASKAAINESEATLAASRAELEVAIETEKLNPGAVSKIKVTQLREKLKAAVAAVEKVEAISDEADFGLQAARENVKSCQAQLDNAAFDLQQCTVYAPADGFVTAWTIREGTMAVALPFAPVGTYVDTSRTLVIANFSQNTLRNVKPGDPIEIAFKTHPGEFFSGTVETIIQASGEGQFVNKGVLENAGDVGNTDGKLVVKFQLDDPEMAQSLAMGTAGTVVIYTDHGKPFHVISKVVIRMNAWMYYLIPF